MRKRTQEGLSMPECTGSQLRPTWFRQSRRTAAFNKSLILLGKGGQKRATKGNDIEKRDLFRKLGESNAGWHLGDYLTEIQRNKSFSPKASVEDTSLQQGLYLTPRLPWLSYSRYFRVTFPRLSWIIASKMSSQHMQFSLAAWNSGSCNWTCLEGARLEKSA